LYDPCASATGAFSGVTCKTINSVTHINSLSLASYNMKGSIPSSLGGLSSIVSLLLNNNLLSREVPR